MANNPKSKVAVSTLPAESREKFLVSADVGFAVTEAYKILRTNLMFSLAGSSNHCIAVTSSQAGEGKSTTAANLALTMAQTEAKVLLIDADLRKPTQHQTFHVKNKFGLSSILGGFCSVEEGIHTGVKAGLSIIPSGPIPPNPSELLSSKNMETLLEYLRQKYDYVFIDTPPVNVVTDVLVVSPFTAGLVLVVKQGCSTHEEMKKAIASIEFANAKILGIALTNAALSGSSYSKYKTYKAYREYK